MDFRNTYENEGYAAAYAALEFQGTYALAFRDLPEIIGRHARGRRALDFGCGAGRNEWPSFSTKAFPENRAARCGDIVRIINLAVDERMPTEDVLHGDRA